MWWLSRLALRRRPLRLAGNTGASVRRHRSADPSSFRTNRRASACRTGRPTRRREARRCLRRAGHQWMGRLRIPLAQRREMESGNLSQRRHLGSGPKLFGADLTRSIRKKALFRTAMHIRSFGLGAILMEPFIWMRRNRSCIDSTPIIAIFRISTICSYADPLLTRGLFSMSSRSIPGGHRLLYAGPAARNWFVVTYLAYDSRREFGEGVMRLRKLEMSRGAHQHERSDDNCIAEAYISSCAVPRHHRRGRHDVLSGQSPLSKSRRRESRQFEHSDFSARRWT